MWHVYLPFTFPVTCCLCVLIVEKRESLECVHACDMVHVTCMGKSAACVVQCEMDMTSV